jgi:hypothetical protein
VDQDAGHGLQVTGFRVSKFQGFEFLLVVFLGEFDQDYFWIRAQS